MKTKFALLATATLVITGIYAPLAAESIRPMVSEDTEFSTIAQGTYSAWPSRDFFIIKDQETWQQVWSAMTSNLNPQPVIPPINFSEFMAIAVFIGPHLSLLYDVEITEIYADGERQIVYIRATPAPHLSSPGFTRGLVQMNPYHIVKTEKNDLPTRFILTRQGIKN